MHAESLESTKEASSFLSAFQTSQVHPLLDIRTAKSMNQFFYNMATTTWALKHVLLLIDHNKFSRSTMKQNIGIYYRTCNTTQSVKQQLNEDVFFVSKIVNGKFANRIRLTERSQKNLRILNENKDKER